jgi:three-Cys-motif partner protein
MSPEHRDYLRPAADDGLAAAEVGPWAEEKYRRLGMYAEMFSTGMKNRWDKRVYLDLFAGPGHAIIREGHLRVLTSPLLALTVRDPFDKYIFCEAHPDTLAVLRRRSIAIAPSADVDYLAGDANAQVDGIAAAIPAHSRGSTVLSFCFIDPFGLDIQFETVRRLGTDRAMDFLILLALGMDATRNWRTYLGPGNNRVAAFLGNPAWRERWMQAEREGKSPIRFLAEEYAHGMSGLGYLTPGLERMIEVRTRDNNMRLYYLAFFSKNERGYEFWDEVRRYSTDQLGLL